MLLVKLIPQQFKSLRPVHKGLVRRYEEPFPILGKVGKVSYKVELPPRLKIHPVFHVSYLKPYHEDKNDPNRGFSKRAPTEVVTFYDKKLENIIADRIHYGSSRSRLSSSERKARRGRLRLRWGKVSQDASNEPPHGVWKVLEMPREVHTSLHYGGRHERSPRLSREF
ncbi:hypothetical protein AAG906_041143 [Vitis piasezkii]